MAKFGAGERGGDASFRSYDRLISHAGQGRTAIVMDAPPEKEDVRPFLKVRAYYEEMGYRVPALLGAQEEQGLLLLEDLGEDSFSKVLREKPEAKALLYRVAVALLVAKQDAGVRGVSLPAYDRAVLERGTLVARMVLAADHGGYSRDA